MPIAVQSLDHLVLTVANIRKTCDFYQSIMGMTPETFTPADGSTRWALKFGAQKINLHQAGQEFDPKASNPRPGSADLCLLSDAPIAEWQNHLSENGVSIEEGPVHRTGATGPILSIYLRDPDGNLIEISNPA
ncbi:VOC family protein [Primorskyibacter sp. 2E233]|uniref:VOC family protein n=1 Tax=Primorskyibacter sp. 2E233 TaxID=3413431 RepID=UPI003BF0D6B9